MRGIYPIHPLIVITIINTINTTTSIQALCIILKRANVAFVQHQDIFSMSSLSPKTRNKSSGKVDLGNDLYF